VDWAPNITAELPCGSKTSPAIVTVACLPPEVRVYVPPTEEPVSVRNAVLTSTWCGPAYQCPPIRV
jgi:hypothetical protein